jgi:glucose-6-phosphate 1-epimerase
MCNYEDALNKKRRLETTDRLHFDREIDRIYQCNQVNLHSNNTTLQLSSDGFDDTVIWNPHQKTAASIGDLDDGEWQRFVCIEAANVLTKIVLPPGAEWSATHTISVA